MTEKHFWVNKKVVFTAVTDTIAWNVRPHGSF